MSKTKHKARERAVQALYMWRVGGNDLSDIELHFLTEQDMKQVDKKYFKELLHKAPTIADACENAIKPLLDRPLDEVDPVEFAILELAFYELTQRIDVPYRVVINESVELAKTFGAEESFKFINGVVDKLARQFREVEVNAARSTHKGPLQKNAVQKAPVLKSPVPKE